MDGDGIPDVLKTERMGHELAGMHGIYDTSAQPCEQPEGRSARALGGRAP